MGSAGPPSILLLRGDRVTLRAVTVGSCSLNEFDRTSRHCSLGIIIGESDYLGKGFGTEAQESCVERRLLA
ncbi:MAG: GNAT family N-acetyltransferase [Candidatus Rokuibacteriota bacterium]